MTYLVHSLRLYFELKKQCLWARAEVQQHFLQTKMLKWHRKHIMESTKSDLLAINGFLLRSEVVVVALFAQSSTLASYRDLHSKFTTDGSIGHSYALPNKLETYLLHSQKKTFHTDLHPHVTVEQRSSHPVSGKFLMLQYEKDTMMSLVVHL